MHLGRLTRAVLGLLIVCTIARSASAIILYDKWYRNKSAPTGSYLNSGWQWTGNWGGFLGVPIAKNYFVTASHVGGSVGQSLSLNGKNYQTIAVYDDPNSDLRIWKTSTAFTSWAPLYGGNTEVGKTAILIGRGTQRGAEVKVNNVLKGWQWGASDGLKSWGRNKVRSIVAGGSGIGSVLGFTFDRTSTNGGDKVTEECTVSNGDSSGAVFVNVNAKWYLAGIIYSVETPYKTSSSSATFNAAIFDKGGLYYNNAYVGDAANDVPAYMYATRISTNLNWVRSIVGTVTTSSAMSAPSAAPASAESLNITWFKISPSLPQE